VTDKEFHFVLRRAFLMIIRYTDERREADEFMCVLSDALSDIVIYLDRRYGLKSHS
jgi:hypothetical protein